MVKVRQFRLGEGLAAAVRAEIDQLELNRVFSCTYDDEERGLSLVLERSKAARHYPADPMSLERIYEHLRLYAQVRNELRSYRSRTAA
jgi:hypothetical protein